MIKPKNFYGPKNEELRHHKSFEKNCIVLAEYANKQVKECNTKEYFALLEHHNKIVKANHTGKQSKPQL